MLGFGDRHSCRGGGNRAVRILEQLAAVRALVVSLVAFFLTGCGLGLNLFEAVDFHRRAGLNGRLVDRNCALAAVGNRDVVGRDIHGNVALQDIDGAVVSGLSSRIADGSGAYGKVALSVAGVADGAAAVGNISHGIRFKGAAGNGDVRLGGGGTRKINTAEFAVAVDGQAPVRGIRAVVDDSAVDFAGVAVVKGHVHAFIIREFANVECDRIVGGRDDAGVALKDDIAVVEAERVIFAAHLVGRFKTHILKGQVRIVLDHALDVVCILCDVDRAVLEHDIRVLQKLEAVGFRVGGAGSRAGQRVGVVCEINREIEPLRNLYARGVRNVLQHGDRAGFAFTCRDRIHSVLHGGITDAVDRNRRTLCGANAEVAVFILVNLGAFDNKVCYIRRECAAGNLDAMIGAGTSNRQARLLRLDGCGTADFDNVFRSHARIVAAGIEQDAIVSVQDGAVANLTSAGAGGNDLTARDIGGTGAHKDANTAVCIDRTARDIQRTVLRMVNAAGNIAVGNNVADECAAVDIDGGSAYSGRAVSGNSRIVIGFDDAAVDRHTGAFHHDTDAIFSGLDIAAVDHSRTGSTVLSTGIDAAVLSGNQCAAFKRKAAVVENDYSVLRTCN